MRSRREGYDTEPTAAEALASYEALVQEVRMQRHELGNQLGALDGADDAARRHYLEALMEDQRYGNLLLCGDPLLAGLLYQKCTVAEQAGIPVRFHIHTRLEHYALPQHRLIGIVGVLADNAIEASRTLPEAERGLRIVIGEADGRYAITVANRHPYIPYEELAGLFAPGRTSKGAGRGLGLAHARSLCTQGQAQLSCGNEPEEDGNEIVFTLYLERGEAIEEESGKAAGRSAASAAESEAAKEAGKRTAADEAERSTEAPSKRRWTRGRSLAIAAAVLVLLLFISIVLLRSGRARQTAADAVSNEEDHTSERDGTAREADGAASVSSGAETELTARESADAPAGVATGALPGSEPVAYRPFHVSTEGGVAGEPGELLPKTESWRGEGITLISFSYDYYDEDGRRIQRESYVASGYDNREDFERLHEMGISLSTGRAEAYLRELEQWSYDGQGRVLSYQRYKKYADYLAWESVLTEQRRYDAEGYESLWQYGAAEQPTRLERYDAEGRLQQRTELDEAGGLLWEEDYRYDAEGFDTESADGSWTWDAAHTRAELNAADYYGEETRIVWHYAEEELPVTDGEGCGIRRPYQVPNGFYAGPVSVLPGDLVTNGSAWYGAVTGEYQTEEGWRRGYLAERDESGRLLWSFNAMPVLYRERLPQAFFENYYDEEHTKRLRPREYVDLFRFYIYDEEGRVQHCLEIDPMFGRGHIYVEVYDDAGRHYASYVYRIRAGRLDSFTMELPGARTIGFVDGYEEYMVYEEWGGKFLASRYFLRELIVENARGEQEWYLRFTDGRLSEYGHGGERSSWTEPVY